MALGSGSSGGKRRRKGKRIDRLGAMLCRLVRALREQPGLNVRQPSHHAPPYRATQWTFADDVTVAADSFIGGTNPPTFINVAFTGEGATDAGAPGFAAAEPFPEGARGVVAWFRVQLTQAAGGVLFNGTDSRVSLMLNGAPVRGLERIRSSGVSQMVVGAAGGPFMVDAPPLLVPVHLAPGDTLQLRLENTNLAAAMTMFVSIAGWLYPTKRDEPSIFGTLVD